MNDGVSILYELAGLPCDGIYHILGKVVSWHFGALFIDNLELELLRGFLEAVEGLGLDLTQFLQGSVIGVESEESPLKVDLEVLHTPDGSLHLKQEECVVFLRLHDLSAGILIMWCFSWALIWVRMVPMPSSFFSSPKLACVMKNKCQSLPG